MSVVVLATAPSYATLPAQQQQPERIAREAVLSGRRIPALVATQLEARGVDVGALEQRLIQQQWKH